MIYEWDAAKASDNLRKHKVSFAEAASVFLDPLALSFFDPDHSDEEDREITIGISFRKRALFVSHCERGERIRIISARTATKKERLQYEKNINKESR
ncbi:MAG TPA: BrnT family toxin [Candidatus Binatia bacterium]